MQDNKMFFGSIEITNDNIKQYLCNNIEDNGKAFVRDIYNPENSIIIKKVGRNILTGDENWRYDYETKTFVYFQENKFNEDGLGKYDNMMCTRFRWQEYSKEVKYGMFQGNEKGEIMFKFYDKVESVDVFKEWLKNQFSKGIPVEVYFALQYPIIVKIEKAYNWCYLHKLTREFSHISVDNSSTGIQPIINISTRTIKRKK